MVSFSCEACGDVLTKKKLDPHRNQCRGASFTCLDCMVHFHGTEYRSHTACVSEAQKYQGHLYRDKDGRRANKGEKRKSLHSQEDPFDSMVPKKAYVEEVPDEGENAVAIIDVPPRAPTPPAAVEALHENVNVFDFLVTDDEARSNGHSLPATRKSKVIADGKQAHHSHRAESKESRLSQGFSYGNAPVQPSFERYDSWSQFPQSQNEPSQQSQAAEARPAYITQIVTPGPDRERRSARDDKSDKKRKRGYIDDLDLSVIKRPGSRDETMTDAPSRILHTGLTGGLTRLVTDESFYEDRIDAGPTPISPIKRNKREREFYDAGKRISSYDSTRTTTTTTSSRQNGGADDHHRSKRREHDYHSEHNQASRRHRDSSTSSDDHRPSTRRLSRVKAIDFKPHDSRNSSVQPSASNQLVHYGSRADLFLSFVTKGPDSERGCSVNKALKRYHRERPSRGDEKDEDDKDLWKSLRLRRNDRGEVVLFVA